MLSGEKKIDVHEALGHELAPPPSNEKRGFPFAFAVEFVFVCISSRLGFRNFWVLMFFYCVGNGRFRDGKEFMKSNFGVAFSGERGSDDWPSEHQL
jgi:hypothetical protein